jgi:predicted phosphoadenosine phosphosulfate sulfurtransferase
MTWQEWSRSLLALYPPKERVAIARSVAQVIRMHQRKTRRPIHETQDDVMSGLSWRYICQMVSRGDLKGRKKGQLTQRAIAAAGKAGLTFEQVKALEK